VRKWYWGLVSAVGFALACATLGLRKEPSGSDRIIFSHERHARAKVECVACHDEVFDAKTLDAVQLPKEGKCLECHRQQKAAGNCSMCHTDVRFAGPFPKREPTLRMSHADHLARVGEDCSRCHLKLPEPNGATALAPPMSTCLSCHQHHQEYAAGTCQGCHVDLARFPLRPVSDFSHQGNFLHNHGREARSASNSCVQCHEQNFCQDCHASSLPMRLELRQAERVDRNFIHFGDYLSRHSVEARADEALCRRCHGTSFCTGCHTRENLSSAAANPRNPHPPGWSYPGSGEFHGPAARRDIASCASCHDQGSGSNCVHCHKVGGIGGNPHPPGWTMRHGQNDIHGNSMCLICHQ
jgi:hypothetical protein